MMINFEDGGELWLAGQTTILANIVLTQVRAYTQSTHNHSKFYLAQH